MDKIKQFLAEFTGGKWGHACLTLEEIAADAGHEVKAVRETFDRLSNGLVSRQAEKEADRRARQPEPVTADGKRVQGS